MSTAWRSGRLEGGVTNNARHVRSTEPVTDVQNYTAAEQKYSIN